MSFYTREFLAQRNISLKDYERPPRDVTVNDFATAQHVVAVKRTEHHPLIQARFPEWLERVEFWEVHDQDCAPATIALPHLEREVLALIDRLVDR